MQGRGGMMPFFSELKPVPMLALLKRELLTTLRSFRSFLTVAAIVLFLVIMFTSFWTDNMSLMMIGAMARNFSEGFVYFAMFVSILVIPGLAAGTIALERERDTLDLLKTTLLPPKDIIFGKMINTVGFFMILFIACLPAFGAVFFMVGVEIRTLALSMGVILASGVAMALCGMMASSLFRSMTAAMVGSYSLAILFQFGPIIVMGGLAFVSRQSSIGQSLDSAWFYCPFASLSQVFQPKVPYNQLALAGVYVMAVCLFCFFVIRYRFNRPERFAGANIGKAIDDQKLLKARRRKFPYYLVDPLKRKKPIKDGRNPVMTKELRWSALGKFQSLIRAFYLAFIISFAMSIFVIFMKGFRNGIEGLCFQNVTLGLLFSLPILVINLFTKEFETNSIDSLKMTLLKPKDVVGGKFAAGFVSVSPVALAVILSLTMLCFLGDLNWPLFFMGIVLIILYVTQIVCVGIFSSIFARSTVAAFMSNYVLLFAIHIVPGVSMLLLKKEYRESIYFILPPYFLFSKILDAYYTYWGESRDGPDKLLMLSWLGNVILYFGLSYVFYRLSVNWFRTRTYDRTS